MYQLLTALQKDVEPNASDTYTIIEPYEEPSESTRQELGFLSKQRFWFPAGISATSFFLRILVIRLFLQEGSPPASLLGEVLAFTPVVVFMCFEETPVNHISRIRRYINLILIKTTLAISACYILRTSEKKPSSLAWLIFIICLLAIFNWLSHWRRPSYSAISRLITRGYTSMISHA